MKNAVWKKAGIGMMALSLLSVGSIGFAGAEDQDPPKTAQVEAKSTGTTPQDTKEVAAAPQDQMIKKQPAKIDDQGLGQQLRDAIMKDPYLSAGGKSIQINAQAGKLTLRGTVASLSDKERIDSKARQIAGPGNVENQLEVKSEAKPEAKPKY